MKSNRIEQETRKPGRTPRTANLVFQKDPESGSVAGATERTGNFGTRMDPNLLTGIFPASDEDEDNSVNLELRRPRR
ncbi:MAG: hypothetical protein ACREH8_19870, partial [Opitutaceae bacterium]